MKTVIGENGKTYVFADNVSNIVLIDSKLFSMARLVVKAAKGMCDKDEIFDLLRNPGLVGAEYAIIDIWKTIDAVFGFGADFDPNEELKCGLPQPLFGEVFALVREGKKIPAIKHFRENFYLYPILKNDGAPGLREAKEKIDEIYDAWKLGKI